MLPPRTLEWVGDTDGYVRMIDQTLLPGELRQIEVRDVETMWDAIKVLRVRGAPAIGVAAAMGLVIGLQKADDPWAKLEEVSDYLASSRPTAVNLFWALDRMKTCAGNHADVNGKDLLTVLLAEAQAIRDEDAAMCRAIGQAGKHLIPDNGGMLTHCNAGSLATAEYGTALSVCYAAHEDGRSFRVYADETRPLLQGSRLTAWELHQAGIDVVVLCDNMAAVLMREGEIDVVVTGADRIAANGDAANKIGTYGVAVLARAHGIPFYIAAPSSTFDLTLEHGDLIPIEQRDAAEIREGFGTLTAPKDVPCFSPAFDVTPASLIQGIITEKGLITPVSEEAIRKVLQ